MIPPTNISGYCIYCKQLVNFQDSVWLSTIYLFHQNCLKFYFKEYSEEIKEPLEFFIEKFETNSCMLIKSKFTAYPSGEIDIPEWFLKINMEKK
jgi:hypothetical protein